MSTCRLADGRPKRRYGTRAAAKAAARRIAVQFGDAEQQPYRCPHCQWFHLGHYPTDAQIRAALRRRHRRADA